MPTCCAGLTWKDGKAPAVSVIRKDKATGKWGAIVGSAMLDGYDTRGELMAEVRREQRSQRVFQCGHVVRQDAAVPMKKLYRVEWMVLGAWVPTETFADYAAADAWAEKLVTSVDGRNGVRVIDLSREHQARDAVIWSVQW